MRGRSRSSAAVAVSAVMHAVALAALVVLASVAPPALPREQRPVVFVTMAPVPVAPSEPLALPKIDSSESIDTPAVPELAVPSPPLAKVEPFPVPAEPARPAPAPTIEPPKPASPPIIVGLFADSAAATRAIEPPKRVEAAGFDAPSVVARTPAAGAVATGAFDPLLDPGQRERRPGVVAASGFGAARTEPIPAKQTAAVRSSGFDDVRPEAAAPARPPLKPDHVDNPVEITFKPTPIYTDEARALKLEGDVLLEVEFAASGYVRVLSVAKGLGHGLDEAAMRAAAAMRFKPARAAGRPIDFRTTVHIVFRLA